MSSAADNWIYGDSAPDLDGRDLVGLKAKWILRRLAGRVCGRVLDYGCGEGKHLRMISPDAERVGVDIRAMRTEADFEFRQLPPTGSLPFADDSFDVVLSCDVLEHVASIEHSLDEIRRVLRPGGAFIGFVPLEGGLAPHSLIRAFSPNIYVETKDHVRYLTRRQMIDLLCARFCIRHIEHSYHLFGAFMDAAFFASFKLPVLGSKIESFWRGMDNPFYRRAQASQSPTMLGRVVGLANRLAYYESAILRNVSIGACGLHFDVEKPR